MVCSGIPGFPGPKDQNAVSPTEREGLQQPGSKTCNHTVARIQEERQCEQSKSAAGNQKVPQLTKDCGLR